MLRVTHKMLFFRPAHAAIVGGKRINKITKKYDFYFSKRGKPTFTETEKSAVFCYWKHGQVCSNNYRFGTLMSSKLWLKYILLMRKFWIWLLVIGTIIKGLN